MLYQVDGLRACDLRKVIAPELLNGVIGPGPLAAVIIGGNPPEPASQLYHVADLPLSQVIAQLLYFACRADQAGDVEPMARSGRIVTAQSPAQCSIAAHIGILDTCNEGIAEELDDSGLVILQALVEGGIADNRFLVIVVVGPVPGCLLQLFEDSDAVEHFLDREWTEMVEIDMVEPVRILAPVP